MNVLSQERPPVVARVTIADGGGGALPQSWVTLWVASTPERPYLDRHNPGKQLCAIAGNLGWKADTRPAPMDFQRARRWVTRLLRRSPLWAPAPASGTLSGRPPVGAHRVAIVEAPPCGRPPGCHCRGAPLWAPAQTTGARCPFLRAPDRSEVNARLRANSRHLSVDPRESVAFVAIRVLFNSPGAFRNST